ncbi:MAG: hypothetical protein QGG40_06440 [Myxococcota bacterium]|nr:hypothetical protein [Myxococcota bacterium]
MAKSRPSVQKRRNEAIKMEKKQAKAARKAQRDASREAREIVDGIDPDLAGIIPGPQPHPYEDDEEEEAEEG